MSGRTKLFDIICSTHLKYFDWSACFCCFYGMHS